MLHSATPLDAQSLLKEAYQMNATTPKELQLNQMRPFHPLVPGYYPTLNPTELITFQDHPFQTEKSDLSNLSTLLGNLLIILYFYIMFCIV